MHKTIHGGDRAANPFTALRGLLSAALCAALLALTACQSDGMSSGGTAAASEERPATREEIAAIAVGNTINGAMTYNEDGSYLYKGGNPGRYTIRRGRICVQFQSGGARCDRVVTTDGESFMMINRNGQRFPFG